MQDRPTAAELLRAAQEWLANDLQPNITGRLRFHARVLQNVLGILEREWEGEEAALRREWERLGSLLGAAEDSPATMTELRDGVRERNIALARSIRDGDLDARLEEAVDSVYATIVDKLAIANPNHASSAT